MGLDATKPLASAEMTFKRIRVPGEEHVDLAKAVDSSRSMDWRHAIEG
jgi:2,5-furandicarboxylate decarboxylase 1